MKARALLAALLLVSLAVPAGAAEDLVSGLSTDLIQIRSDFTGTDIVVFGAVEAANQAPGGENPDIVVAIRGPETPITVRKKDRVLGLWINRDQVTLTGMPGYYYVGSTRPLDMIADKATLQRFQLGSANLEAQGKGNVPADQLATFQAAAVHLLKNEQLYWDTTDIQFLSRTLFRVRIPVPAIVPPGQYRAEVYLFRNGAVVSAQSSPLFIDKTGLERDVYNFAYDASLIYGIAAVFMAVFLGWLAFALFRQRI